MLLPQNFSYFQQKHFQNFNFTNPNKKLKKNNPLNHSNISQRNQQNELILKETDKY